MTPKVRDKILEEAKKHIDSTDYLIQYVDAAHFGFALAVEMHKHLVEALDFYSVNGLSKVEVGQAIDSRLALEWYVNGGFARNAIAKLKEDMGE